MQKIAINADTSVSFYEWAAVFLSLAVADADRVRKLFLYQTRF